MTQVTKIINSSFFLWSLKSFYYYPVENETVCVRVGMGGNE